MTYDPEMGERFNAVTEQTASQMSPQREGSHPLFSAVQSVVLGRKYGINPLIYMHNPGLRSLDTRQAALETLQSVGSNVKRWRAGNTPTVPSPAAGPVNYARPIGAQKPQQPPNPLARRYAPFKNPGQAPPTNWIG